MPPTTRSSSNIPVVHTQSPVRTKRKVQPSLVSDAPSTVNKKARVHAPTLATEQAITPASSTSSSSPTLLPAVLSFSFDEAKQHLIHTDARFEDLFAKLPCKPFQQLERVHPFRALVSSILGQQISWLAARSINHKFVRLYDSTIPEKPDDYSVYKTPTSFFPSPEVVASTDIATLKTAGLSTRKAEYVQDLAKRFADGRLSAAKLNEADDDELAQMLTEVRGIGRWTVDMFAIFSLRRPDILPVGDLGVQRGLLRWFLALHSPTYNFSLSPEKVALASPKKKASPIKRKTSQDEEILSVPETNEAGVEEVLGIELATDGVEKVAPENSEARLSVNGVEETQLPPPFTPSIKATLSKPPAKNGTPNSLPDTLTPAILKSRLEGKKKIKGAFLTPNEMEALTQDWKPYRSLGVYYMWSLAEADV